MIGVAGCAARSRPGAAPSASVGAVPATQALAATTVPTNTTLALEDILPAAVLPAPREVSPTTFPSTAPSTAPVDRPPIDAVLLYGRAVEELNAGRRVSAVDLLEKAVVLDPGSFELHYTLGRSYSREGATPDPRAVAELERAAEINPDHLRLQTELGRILFTTGEEQKGIWHLRLALKTSDYAKDEAGAAVAELLLSRALARAGYHAAAVEVYERLMTRLDNPTAELRNNPEIAFLIARPELVRLQAAESYEKTGQFDKALAAYRAAAEKDPGSFELRARVVEALVGLKHYDEAAAQAADAVARFRASPPAVALLKEVGDASGAGAATPIEQLQRLVRQRPGDRSLAFALADLMKADRRVADARAVLHGVADAAPVEPEAVRRLYELERDAGDDAAGNGAARFLIGWSEKYPDAVHLLGEHWDDLLRRATPGAAHLGLRELRALAPASDAGVRWAAAKDFWVAHVARLRHRRDVAREALKRSADARPVFAPALRAWAGWDRGELGMTAEQRNETVERLASAAEGEGDAALAGELRGMLKLSARDFAGARQLLAKAAAKGKASPERQFALAVAARGAGDEAAFEQVLWKLVSDFPGFDDAYDALYAWYEGRDAEGATAKVLSAWLAADPAGVSPRLVQVREQVREGRVAAAQGLIQRLFNERPGDPRVVSMLRAMYGQGGRTRTWLVAELQQRHASAPGDLAAATQLVDLLADDGKGAEATRVLDATHAAVATDPDLLYQVAHLYERAGDKATTEKVLGEVLALEPNHAPAANDLGYSLAEDGRELGRAEELARVAVGAEPDNASFLDSLGWVLYKRGKLDEARKNLEKSAGSEGEAGEDDAAAGGADAAVDAAADAGSGGKAAAGPDPVVLDHLGDTIYRQGDAAAAGAQWERAARRLAEMPAAQRDRDDLKQLRLQLDRKHKQLEAGQPVSTAPVAGGGGGDDME